MKRRKEWHGEKDRNPSQGEREGGGSGGSPGLGEGEVKF